MTYKCITGSTRLLECVHMYNMQAVRLSCPLLLGTGKAIEAVER
jgi:hypothetical protein